MPSPKRITAASNLCGPDSEIPPPSLRLRRGVVLIVTTVLFACPVTCQREQGVYDVPGKRLEAATAHSANQTRCTKINASKEKPHVLERLIGFLKRMFGGKGDTNKPNRPPVIRAFVPSLAAITVACPPGYGSLSKCPATTDEAVQLTAMASDPDGDALSFSYTVTAGMIRGTGSKVVWDLTGMGPGTAMVSLEVDDNRGCVASASTNVTIANCPDCMPIEVCPTISSDCPSDVDEGVPITFTAKVGSAVPPATKYHWTVSAGTISSGQGSLSITVDTRGLAGKVVTATLEVGDLDPSCGRTTSCSTQVKSPIAMRHSFGIMLAARE